MPTLFLSHLFAKRVSFSHNYDYFLLNITFMSCLHHVQHFYIKMYLYYHSKKLKFTLVSS